MPGEAPPRVLEERLPSWARAKRVTVTDGLARTEVDPSQRYEPTAFPNLPALLAKATTEAEVVRFLRSFGPLGWGQLQTDPDRPVWPERGQPELLSMNEPVDWIIAQAQTVKFAWELIEALQAGDDDRLERMLRQRRISLTQAEPAANAGPDEVPVRLATYYVCRAAGYAGEEGRFSSDDEDYLPWYTTRSYLLQEGVAGRRAHAEAIVVDLVDGNTVGLRHVLRRDMEHGGFGLQLRVRGLIEIIWMHVRDAALGGPLGSCLECGAPFFITDKRQRYCPPDLPGGKSRCAAKAQKRRQRSR